MENLISHSTEKLCMGTVLSFKTFLVSKTIREKRVGGYDDFLSKSFFLTVPNEFDEKPLCVSESFGYRKFFMPVTGLSRFSMETFLSDNAENYRKGTQ